MVLVSYSILFISLWSNQTSWCLNFRWLYILSITIFPTSAYSLSPYHQCASLVHMFLSSSDKPLTFGGFRVIDPLSQCLINDCKGAEAIRKLDISIWADTGGQNIHLYLCLGNIKHVFYLVFKKAFCLSLLTFSIC